MSISTKAGMDSDSFIAWAMEQPEGKRYELHGGEIVEMPAERVLHADVKGLVYLRLSLAIQAGRLPCKVLPDGIAVEIDRRTVLEPDCQVHCGDIPLPGAVKVTSPIIVVEVLSPSTRAYDQATKRAAYFRVPTIRHYLIVDPEPRRIIHHQRTADGSFSECTYGDEPIPLDPPGIVLSDIFPE